MPVLQAVPQLLYHLGSTHTAISTQALRMLHNAGRFCSPGDLVSVAIDGMQAEMYPLFCRPGIGPAKGAKAQEGRRPSTIALLPQACQVGYALSPMGSIQGKCLMSAIPCGCLECAC